MRKKKSLFGTDGIRGIPGCYPLTAEVLQKIGFILGKYIFEKKKDTPMLKQNLVLMNHDSRQSHTSIENELSFGLHASGCTLKYAGMLPTSAISAILQKEDSNYIGGITISASHNSSQFNGMKFFDAFGKKLTHLQETKIEDLFFQINDFKVQNRTSSENIKTSIDTQIKKQYYQFLVSHFENNDFQNHLFVFDCANGASSEIVPAIFQHFKADVCMLNHRPSGNNINDNQSSIVNTDYIINTVREKNAHAGCFFDGDADRVILVDELGNILDGEYLLSIIAQYLQKKNQLKHSAIAISDLFNLGFREWMQSNNIKTHLSGVGDQKIYEKMIQLNLVLGGEPSGHIILKELLSTGDGILVACYVLWICFCQNKKKLSYYFKQFSKYPQIQLNLKVNFTPPLASVKALQNEINQAENSLNQHGRVIIRYSGTEPILRIFVEDQSHALAEKIANRIYSVAQANIPLSQ